MSPIILFLLVLHSSLLVENKEIVVLQAVGKLGWKQFTVLTDAERHLQVDFHKSSSKKGLQMSSSTSNVKHCFNDFGFGVAIWNQVNVSLLAATLECSDPYHVLIICEECYEAFRSIDRVSNCFYFFDPRFDDQMRRIQIFAGQNRVIGDSLIAQDFNLNGATITICNLSWQPYIEYVSCENAAEGSNYKTGCRVDGIFAEQMAAMARKFNFTLEYNEYYDWGSHDLHIRGSAAAESVFGSLTNKGCDVSLGPWQYTSNRGDLMDFTEVCIVNTYQMSANLRNAPVDYSLFVRPFDRESWSVIIYFALTVSLLALLLFKCKHTDFYAVIVFTGWILFLLLHTFYSGALTMFFTAPPKVPFLTLYEGVKAYPDWKLFVVDESKVFLYESRFEETLKRIEENPREFIVPDFVSAIGKIRDEPGMFHYTTNQRIAYFINQGGIDGEGVDAFGEPVLVFGHSLMYKKSPHKAMINKGLRWWKESGLNDQITKKWIGKLRKKSVAEKKVLSLSHVAMAFVLLAATFIICLLILCAEKVSAAAN